MASASQLLAQFTNKTRESGEAYVTAEGPALELVRSLHLETFDGLFPNDWVFAKSADILDALANGDDADEIPDSLVDVYTADLIEWIQTATFRGFVDQAMTESTYTSLDSAISAGQYNALSAMCSVISAALDESAAAEA